MKKWFADANLFLRFFTQDDARQSATAKRLLQKCAAGEVLLVVGPPVLFEVAWTLRAAYRQPQGKVVEVLRAILGSPGIEVLDADVVEDALRRSETTGVEFADSYIMAASVAEECEAIATFNRSDFVKLGARLAEF